MTDALDDFDRRQLTFDDDTKVVYVAGTGPAVVVMTEMPGITPHVARFARWVRDAGLTVWLPSLFGRDGAEPTNELFGEAFGSACVQREFDAFAAGVPSPMVSWLRQLAAHAHTECGGPGVGAIGMCFTGNFALALVLEDSVLAPVMAQPSLPFDDPAGTFIHDADMVTIRRRLDAESLTVLAYRFEGDPFCPKARFDTFRERLGDRLLARELPDSAAALDWIGAPHSVVTTCLIDAEGEPTAAARNEILAFFTERLQAR
ncbi:MAG TPA: dienelactone hydrolase family protein [Ilumatobacter sp.]|nr:dienelactone hydrolase family protein [Ilumatobacter sp.]